MSDFSGFLFSPLLVVLVFRVARAMVGARAPRRDGGASYASVRREILARQVEPASRVRCTVMDWRFDEETMTLVVHPDASAMIYALQQEGTLGDPAGDAQGPARRFVRAVEAQRDSMHAATDYPEPAPGHARFWIVEDDETLTSGDVSIEDLRFRMSSWTSAWGSGRATVNETFESFRIRRDRDRRASVAAGPRPV
jgi:hypothetical protein